MDEQNKISETIYESDKFIDMPISAQALYFHLALRADANGMINNPKSIMRAIGSAFWDFEILKAKGYVYDTEFGLQVILE